MKKIFSVGAGFPVPDGTFVHPVLEPHMTRHGDDWVDAVSIALGRIAAGTSSKIHLHPLVTQTTWVVSGQLTIRMKDTTTSSITMRWCSAKPGML